MANKNYRNIIVLVLWILFIFFMSSFDGGASNAKSYFIVDLFKELGITNSVLAEDTLNFIIRKSGHFLEYLILAILAYNVIKVRFNRKHAYIISILLVLGYACTDEIHQLFVPGREGKLIDVIIDTLGGLTGILIINMTTRFRIKHKQILK